MLNEYTLEMPALPQWTPLPHTELCHSGLILSNRLDDRRKQKYFSNLPSQFNFALID